MNGVVFDIQRFAIHDGPGIRTVVFLKGCPLHCLWCHNPESQSASPEIFYSPEKCIGCRACEIVCAHGGHEFINGEHIYQRQNCVRCGECILECYAQALEISGRTMSVEAVLQEVLRDQPFYQSSAGGITLSGGEPLQQFEFTRALLHSAKEAGLHTCLETSGCSAWVHYAAILPDVDLFLYDIKETDPGRHIDFTGVSNALILENLQALEQAGANLILRCPIIPGLNDRPEHIKQIAAIANQLAKVQEIHILPYHPLGKSKSQKLGKEAILNDVVAPDEKQVQQWLDLLKSHTRVPVRRD